MTAAEPSGSYRRPPRGVEPRTLPAIRPTGRPGQRVLLRRTLEKGPSGQPTQAVKMVKAEGLRGLRAKVRGEGGCDHWGHALTRAHARSCLAEPRTDSTCSTCAVGGPLGRNYSFAGRGTSREWIFLTRKYVSTRPGPEGWARVRAGEGAGQAYLSFAIDWRLTSSDAKRGPARDGGGDEYGQRGAFGAVRAVPGAPREGHRQRDEDGAKTAESGEQEPCSPLKPSSQGPENQRVPNLFKISQPVREICNI